MPLPSVTLTDTQKVTAFANPEDSAGNPGVETAIPTWASADTTIATVAPASDGLSAVITAVATGSVTINVHGTNVNGTFFSQFQVVVTGGPATQFAFSFGTPS